MALECVRIATDAYCIRHDGTAPSATTDLPSQFYNSTSYSMNSSGGLLIGQPTNTVNGWDQSLVNSTFVAGGFLEIAGTQFQISTVGPISIFGTFRNVNIQLTTTTTTTVGATLLTTSNFQLVDSRHNLNDWASISFPNKAGNEFQSSGSDIADADLISTDGSRVNFGTFFNNKTVVLGTETNVVTSGTAVARTGDTFFDFSGGAVFRCAEGMRPVVFGASSDSTYGGSLGDEATGNIVIELDRYRGGTTDIFGFGSSNIVGNGPFLAMIEGARITGPIRTASQRFRGPFIEYVMLDSQGTNSARLSFMGDDGLSNVNIKLTATYGGLIIPSVNFRTTADVFMVNNASGNVSFQAYGDGSIYFTPDAGVSRVHGFNLDGLIWGSSTGQGTLLFRNSNVATTSAFTPVLNNLTVRFEGGPMRLGYLGSGTTGTPLTQSVDSTFNSPVGINLDETNFSSNDAFVMHCSNRSSVRAQFNVGLTFNHVDLLGNELTGITTRVETNALAFTNPSDGFRDGYGAPSKGASDSVNTDITTDGSSTTYNWAKRLQAKTAITSTNGNATNTYGSNEQAVIADNLVHRHYRWDRNIVTNATLTSNGESGGFTTQIVHSEDPYVTTSSTTTPSNINVNNWNNYYEIAKIDTINVFSAVDSLPVGLSGSTMSFNADNIIFASTSLIDFFTGTGAAATESNTVTLSVPSGGLALYQPTSGKVQINSISGTNFNLGGVNGLNAGAAFTLAASGTINGIRAGAGRDDRILPSGSSITSGTLSFSLTANQTVSLDGVDLSSLNWSAFTRTGTGTLTLAFSTADTRPSAGTMPEWVIIPISRNLVLPAQTGTLVIKDSTVSGTASTNYTQVSLTSTNRTVTLTNTGTISSGNTVATVIGRRYRYVYSAAGAIPQVGEFTFGESLLDITVSNVPDTNINNTATLPAGSSASVEVPLFGGRLVLNFAGFDGEAPSPASGGQVNRLIQALKTNVRVMQFTVDADDRSFPFALSGLGESVVIQGSDVAIGSASNNVGVNNFQQHLSNIFDENGVIANAEEIVTTTVGAGSADETNIEECIVVSNLTAQANQLARVERRLDETYDGLRAAFDSLTRNANQTGTTNFPEDP